MKALNYNQLDCETYAAAVAGKVEVIELEDLSGKVPHVGFGGASKSSYVSPNTGKTIFVLERNNTYAADAYYNDVWQFDHDFTATEAADFIRAHDAEKRK